MRILGKVALCCVVGIGLASHAGAVGTGAGTPIANTATADFVVSGTPFT